MTSCTLNNFKRCTLLLVLLIAGVLPVVSAQEGDKLKVYKSIEEALENPDSVVSISLRRERLTEWPEELSRFPNLRYLDLGHNKISRLPQDLSAYSGLVRLELTGNKIDSVGASIGHMVSLKALLLGNNDIFHISENLGELKQLEYLELWSNNIYYLPNSIMELTMLKEVDLRGIQMGEHYQLAIKALIPEGAKVRMSMSCNCD